MSFHDYYFTATGVAVPHPIVGFDNYISVLSNPDVLASFVHVAIFLIINVQLGPVNGLLPTAGDINQIAYGADARVQGLVAVGTATGRPGIRQLAGIAAGWFFGQNASGTAVYDPATGVTRDGVGPDGVVNRNSGAEPTIHGLLTMQVLDADPDLAAVARASATIRIRGGLQVVEAESGALSAGVGRNGHRTRVVVRPGGPPGRHAVDRRLEPYRQRRTRRIHRPHPLS